MATPSKTKPVALAVPALPRTALDELYHFLQYLQFKYGVDLEPVIESIEDEIDVFDTEVALQEAKLSPSTASSES
jgi:hypothetical protein